MYIYIYIYINTYTRAYIDINTYSNMPIGLFICFLRSFVCLFVSLLVSAFYIFSVHFVSSCVRSFLPSFRSFFVYAVIFVYFPFCSLCAVLSFFFFLFVSFASLCLLCLLVAWLIGWFTRWLINWFFDSLFICWCVCVIVWSRVCLFVYSLIRLFVFLYVCLSVCQSVGLSVCLNACIHEQSCSKHTRYKGGKLVKYRSKISNTPPLWLFFAMGWSNPDPLTHQAGHGRDGTALLVELGFARLGKTQGCYPIRSKNGEILWVCGKIGVK